MDREYSEEQPELTNKLKSQKKWDVFPENNTFCCEGRLIFGRNRELSVCQPSVRHVPWLFYMSTFSFTSTFVMFLMFDGLYLAKHVSSAFPVISTVLFIFFYSNFLKASFTDPGIIPRSTKAEADLLESEIERHNRCSRRKSEFTRKIVVKGQIIRLPYCSTCKIIRPPRASHCRSCDNCVEMWDHHCPWIGNCVGRRNYRYFYCFTALMCIGAVFEFLCSVFHLYLLSKEDGGTYLNAINRSPVSAGVCVNSFITSVLTFRFMSFHAHLIARRETTREKKRGISNPDSRRNPFANCAVVLFAPRPPSLIDARGKVISTGCEASSIYTKTDSSTTSSEISKNVYVPRSQNKSSPISQNNSLSTSNNESRATPKIRIITSV